MLARTVIYHHPDEGPMAMLVTRVQEDGALNGEVFTDGARVNQHVEGAYMSVDPGNPLAGTCTLPGGVDIEQMGNALASAQTAAGEAQIASDEAKKAQHKADLAATRSLEHEHKAQEAATKAEEAAKPKPAAKRTNTKK